jgi:hypothetical protein
VRGGREGLPAPASANALALLRFPDRRTAWAVVAAATLAAPVDRLQGRMAALHRAVPMTGARLRGETWHPGSPPEPLIVDDDPLAAPDLVARFDLAIQPPLRIVVGSRGTRMAVACHHAAFDGLSLAALLAALVRPQDHPNDSAQFEAPQPSTEVVDNQEHPTGPSATLPLRGPEPRGPGLERGNAGRAPRGRVPELRGLVGRVVRPADRVAPSLARPVREALAVAEVDLAGPGVTARLASAAVAAAGAHNARLGRPWRRIGINVGLAGGTQGGTPGNHSRYRRVDLRAGEAVGVALDAALARSREPLDQVWSPRFGWVLEPVVGRFSDSLLVSNLGRREVPGATRLEFFPVARGRSAVAVGAAGLAGGPATVSVRARDLSSEDAEALLADLVARLEAGP